MIKYRGLKALMFGVAPRGDVILELFQLSASDYKRGLRVWGRGASVQFRVQQVNDTDNSDYAQLWAKHGLKGALELKGTMYSSVVVYGGKTHGGGVLVISGPYAPNWAEGGLISAFQLDEPASGVAITGNTQDKGILIKYDGTDVIIVREDTKTITLNTWA